METGIGDVGNQINFFLEISSVTLPGWTKSQRKPNDINYVPLRENDTIEYHGAIGIFLITMQHDLKDNVAIIQCSTTPNVISSYRLFPLPYDQPFAICSCVPSMSLRALRNVALRKQSEISTLWSWNGRLFPQNYTHSSERRQSQRA